MSRMITLILLVIVLAFASYITFDSKYIRSGSIVEIRKDAIVVQGRSPYEPAYVLPIDERSREKAQDNQVSKGFIRRMIFYYAFCCFT